jgi:hypothetical protein
VVLSEFKRGKSSLANTIVGAEVLPTGVLPLTSVVTRLRYGPRPLQWGRDSAGAAGRRGSSASRSRKTCAFAGASAGSVSSARNHEP